MNGNRVIATLSGGKASAYCADWAIRTYGKDNVILYFNDVKWEDKDLYRFLNDLSDYWGKEITYDSDGRNPEDIFLDEQFLGNSRLALCSKILKAERLQKFYQDGDTIIFGIDEVEKHRADRIKLIYAGVSKKRQISCTLRFPLIEEHISKKEVDDWLQGTGIKQPRLYDLNYTHNNCSGGCVRMGKKHWNHLRLTNPEVYAERERMEQDFQLATGKDFTIIKDISLRDFRLYMEDRDSKDYQMTIWSEEDSAPVECVGICDTLT